MDNNQQQQHHHQQQYQYQDEEHTTITNTLNDNDWNIRTIHDRKPKFTNQVHQITYISRHCRQPPCTSSDSSKNIRNIIQNWYISYQQYGLDVLLNDIFVYILPTHQATHYYKNYVLFIIFFIVPLSILIEQIVIVLDNDSSNQLLMPQQQQPQQAVIVPLLVSFLFVNDTTIHTPTIIICCCISVVVFLYWVYYNRSIIYYLFIGTFPNHMNPYIPNEYVINMKSNLLRYYSNEYIARRMACCITSLSTSSSSSTETIVSSLLLSQETITQQQQNEEQKESHYSSNVFCLDTSTSIVWKFRLYNTVEDALRYITLQQKHNIEQRRKIEKQKAHVSKTKDNNSSSKDGNPMNSSNNINNTNDWITMMVPSNWTLDRKNIIEPKLDYPRYTNIKYPFPVVEPPLVVSNTNHNPTAIYTTTFTLPWTKNSSTNDDNDDDTYTIICHGIESAYYIYMNDPYHYIGFSKDSRLYSEFVIPTSYLNFIESDPIPTTTTSTTNKDCCNTNNTNTNTNRSDGINTITIVVCKWSDGIYVEDQDHWYLSGIHRSIEIIRHPAKADIIDFQIQADCNGHFECSVEYKCKMNQSINTMLKPTKTASSLPSTATTEEVKEQTVLQQQDEQSTSKSATSKKKMLIARIYNDQQLTADGDEWVEGQCIWEMQKEIEINNIYDNISTKTTKNKKKRDEPITNVNTSKINFSDTLKNIQPWSAEIPNLYTFTISLYEIDNNNNTDIVTCVQSESCRIGFRTINILAPGIIYINHQRIKNFAGMNRHEHDPDTGKVVTIQRMKQDICLLKQNNFNLVRTSHYPNHPLFYKLTDYYGLYVWDEANIEVHGMKPMGRLAHDYGWRATFLSRITRMVHRDRNHPSIIFWSLGNEAGRGRNLQEARDIVKILDPSRPVVYEGGGALAEGTGRTELTDIISTMYPILPRTRHLASRPDEDRPVILCEYSHSMGNSNGNLHYYWEAFWDENLPRLQGGCIWDMIDEGIRVPGSNTNANPSSYFAYGGDFNDPINDAQFCINGMFSPDREPHPAVHEIKYLQQPVRMTPCQSTGYELIETKDGSRIALNVSPMNSNVSITFTAQNRYTFRDLSHLVWTWELRSNRSPDVIRAGRFHVPNLGDNFDICLNEVVTRVRLLERSFMASPRENVYWLNIVGSLKETCSWAESGHHIVSDQFRISFQFDELLSPIKIKPRISLPSSLETISDINYIDIVVYTKHEDEKHFLLAKIDKTTGCIVSFSPNGRNLLSSEHGLVPNFVRAETDNDKGGMELALNFLLIPSWAQTLWYTIYGYHDCSYASCWRSVGLDVNRAERIVCERIRVIDQSSSEKVGVVALCTVMAPAGKVELLKVKLHYTFYSNGRVHLSINVNPLRSLRWVLSLPRVGMKMVLDPSLYHIQYYGRGPHENYPDRKSSAKFGVYNTTPNEMSYYGYIVPSENGSRSDCEYISFSGENGDGLCIVSSTPNSARHDTFSVGASYHSIHEIQKAKHTSDIASRVDGSHPVHVNIDHAVMGLGGDTSWFPGVYDEFLVKPHGEYQYSIWLLPINKNDNIASVVGSAT